MVELEEVICHVLQHGRFEYRVLIKGLLFFDAHNLMICVEPIALATAVVVVAAALDATVATLWFSFDPTYRYSLTMVLPSLFLKMLISRTQRWWIWYYDGKRVHRVPVLVVRNLSRW